MHQMFIPGIAIRSCFAKSDFKNAAVKGDWDSFRGDST